MGILDGAQLCQLRCTSLEPPPLPPPHRHDPHRVRERRLRPPDRRAVDDQHRHRRRRGDRRTRSPSWRGPAASWCASPSTHDAAAAPCRRSSSGSRPGRRRRADRRRLPLQRPPAADASIPAAPRRWPSTASTRATSAASGTTSNFRAIIEVAIAHDKPVRIGVNWGSLDQELLTELMDANARLPAPRDGAGCHRWSHGGERPPLGGARPRRPACRTTGSFSQRQGLARCRTWWTSTACWPRAATIPLHLGLTEAGHGHEGHRRQHRRARACSCRRGSATPSASRLTPAPGGDRTEEVRVAQQILQSLGPPAVSRRR